MSCIHTFIRVSEDCPVETGVAPAASRPLPPAHVIQYELLANAPYKYTHEELLYEVHVRHMCAISKFPRKSGAPARTRYGQSCLPGSLPVCGHLFFRRNSIGAYIIKERAKSRSTPKNRRNMSGWLPERMAGLRCLMPCGASGSKDERMAELCISLLKSLR